VRRHNSGPASPTAIFGVPILEKIEFVQHGPQKFDGGKSRVRAKRADKQNGVVVLIRIVRRLV